MMLHSKETSVSVHEIVVNSGVPEWGCQFLHETLIFLACQ